jgi:oxaloacetate decarboxylase beta subunit
MEQFFSHFISSTGFIAMTWGQLLMLVISCVLLYLGIAREYEPLLLVPIAFGMLLANIPMSGITDGPKDGLVGGLIYYLYQGVKLGIYPPLIFLGIGAMTDFGRSSRIPGAFCSRSCASWGYSFPSSRRINMGFDFKIVRSIAFIGGADGPTAIYVTFAPENPSCWGRLPSRRTLTWRLCHSFSLPS